MALISSVGKFRKEEDFWFCLFIKEKNPYLLLEQRSVIRSPGWMNTMSFKRYTYISELFSEHVLNQAHNSGLIDLKLRKDIPL